MAYMPLVRPSRPGPISSTGIWSSRWETCEAAMMVARPPTHSGGIAHEAEGTSATAQPSNCRASWCKDDRGVPPTLRGSRLGDSVAPVGFSDGRQERSASLCQRSTLNSNDR